MIDFNRNGTVKATLLLEYIKEPDGSIWEPIFYHNNPMENKFSSSDSFNTGLVKNNGMFFNFNVCKELTSWEFLCIQKETIESSCVKYRWIQSKSPFTATWAEVKPDMVTRITTTGYTNSGYGGFYILNSSTYMVTANNSNGNWWGATGCWTDYYGGIPGYGGTVVKTGDMATFVRIDGTNLTPKAKIYPSTGIVVSNNLIQR